MKFFSVVAYDADIRNGYNNAESFDVARRLAHVMMEGLNEVTKPLFVPNIAPKTQAQMVALILAEEVFLTF